jgi:hypothetical protein
VLQNLRIVIDEYILSLIYAPHYTDLSIWREAEGMRCFRQSSLYRACWYIHNIITEYCVSVGSYREHQNNEFEVFTAVAVRSTLFWDITLCSPLKVNWRFEGTYRSIFMSNNKPNKKPVTLKMEAIRSSETSLDFQRTIRRYIPEDTTFNKGLLDWIISTQLLCNPDLFQ